MSKQLKENSVPLTELEGGTCHSSSHGKRGGNSGEEPLPMTRKCSEMFSHHLLTLKAMRGETVSVPTGLAKFKQTRIMLTSLHTSTPHFFKKENVEVMDKKCVLKKT